jgi:hypothetical protein
MMVLTRIIVAVVALAFFILAKHESQYAGETRAAKYQSVIYQLML